MADDNGIPGLDDYTAATDRMRQAIDAGQQPDPGDIDIFRRGNATHRDAYSAAQAGAATPAPPTGVDVFARAAAPWEGDPNNWTNIARRAYTATVAAPSNMWTSAINAVKSAYENRGGTDFAGPQIQLQPGATPAEQEWAARVNAFRAPGGKLPMASAEINKAVGTPAMGPNASMGQQLAEAAIPIVAGSLPAARTAVAGAEGFIPKIEAATTSLAKNAVLAPAASIGGSYVGEKIGGEPGALVGGIAGPLAATAVLPPLLMRGIGAIHQAAFQAPEEPYGTQMQQPGALEVAESADRLGVDPRFLMLANPSGKKMAQTMQSLGFTPSTRTMQADRPMFEEQAANLIASRRALPDPTAETANLISVARDARNQQILQQGIRPNEATSIPAVEQYMASKIGNPLVDVTDTANALKSMYETGGVPGGQPGQQITPAMREAIASKYAELTTPATGVGDPGSGIAAHVMPDGTVFAPWSLVRGWRQGLGMQTQKAIGMQGPQLDHAYGVITNDMKAAAAANGLNPAEFDAAMQIERNEKGAQALKEKLLDPTLLNKSATYAGDFGRRMQNLYEDPDLFKKMMGGEYEPKAAPAPTTAGDIRQQAADVGVLGRASYLPPEQTGQAQSIWRGARQELLLPGVGLAAGLATGMPYAGTALGVLGNYLRSGLSESPTVRNMMMGRPVPWVQAPSGGPSVQAAAQQENIRRAVMGEHNVPKSSAPSSIPPDIPWPGRQSFRDLPTTRPILNAFIGAKVGRSKAETAA